MANATKSVITSGDSIHTVEELAEATKLHHSTIRKMFIDEPGVMRFGRGTGSRGKRQYYTLRIPGQVATRVLGRTIVGG